MILMIGCNPNIYKLANRISVNPEDYKILHPSSPFLKAHMNNGTVYVFNKWEIISKDDDLDKEISYNKDTIKQLKQLGDLYKSGVLSKEEFDKAKSKILN